MVQFVVLLQAVKLSDVTYIGHTYLYLYNIHYGIVFEMFIVSTIINLEGSSFYVVKFCPEADQRSACLVIEIPCSGRSSISGLAHTHVYCTSRVWRVRHVV